jgi:signal peptidase
MTTATHKPPGRPALRTLRTGLSAALLVFVLGLAVAVIGVPFATGSVPLSVLTGSMTPAYPPGTLVIVRPVEPADIRIGDPITYQIQPGRPELVTHRVVAISSSNGDRSYTTQGDSNDLADASPVVPDQVMGRVWYSVPYLGYINTMVGANRSWLVPLLAVALFLFAGYSIASGLVDAVRKRRGMLLDTSEPFSGLDLPANSPGQPRPNRKQNDAV